MDKKLQDYVWQYCLPKEFKEEVKKEWKRAYYNDTKVILEYFFGKHNLTSDAEGEEMLTASRKEVQSLFKEYEGLFEQTNGKCHDKEVALSASRFYGKMCALSDLFGAKCLPDEVESESASKEPKPEEPRFRYDIGQKVKSAYADEILTIKEHCGRVGHDNVYKVEEYTYTWNECELRPYTEPKDLNKSP